MSEKTLEHWYNHLHADELRMVDAHTTAAVEHSTATLRASLAQAEERVRVLGTIITRTAKGLRIDAQDAKLTVEHLRGLCRGIADGMELAMVDAGSAPPSTVSEARMPGKG